MRSGALFYQIEIQRADAAIGDAGTPVFTWRSEAWLRAERVELSTAEFIRNYGAADQTLAVFRTRFYPGVSTADRVVFEGRSYNIREVLVLGRSRGLELRCERID